MPSNVTVIGRTTRIRGRVTGAVDLEVQGYIDGEIAIGGDVTIDSHGVVGASIHGRRLLVRGAVKGDLVGEESILLEAGARVVGDVRAPRIAIAQGALVRGYVQTGDADGAPVRASRAQAAARPAVVQSAPRAIPPTVVRPVPVPSTAAAQPAPRQQAAPARQPPAKAVAAPPPATRRPPPPVVPALRSAKGQIAKKKER